MALRADAYVAKPLGINEVLARKLTQLGILHEYEECDDDHTNIVYRYNVSLPKLANVLWEGAT